MYYYPKEDRDDDPKWCTTLLAQRWILPLAVVSAVFFIVCGLVLGSVSDPASVTEPAAATAAAKAAPNAKTPVSQAARRAREHMPA